MFQAARLRAGTSRGAALSGASLATARSTVPAFHKLDRQPIEQIRVRWGLALQAEILRRRNQSGAEILLPDAVDHRARGRRRIAINQPFSERQPIRRGAGGKWMQKRGNARRDNYVGPEEIAALEQMRLARVFAFTQNQLQRAFGMLAPQLGDLLVGLGEFGDCRPPVTEDRLNLSLRAAFARNREYLAYAQWQQVGDGVGRGRDRKPHPPQVHVLIVVAVPPAVVLLQIESQNRSALIRNRLFGDEHGLARLVAQSGAGLDSPRRLVLAVNREFDGAGQAAALALVVVDRLKLALGLVVIRRGADEFDLRDLLRVACGRGLDFKFGQRARSFDRPPGAAHRQVRVGQQLQSERRNVSRFNWRRHLHAMFGRRVTLSHERTVLHRQILLPARRDVVDDRFQDGPFRLVFGDSSLPFLHPFSPIGSPLLQRDLDLANLTEDIRSIHLLFWRVDGDAAFV